MASSLAEGDPTSSRLGASTGASKDRLGSGDSTLFSSCLDSGASAVGLRTTGLGAMMGGAIPILAPPRRAILAAIAALRCLSSSSGSGLVRSPSGGGELLASFALILGTSDGGLVLRLNGGDRDAARPVTSSSSAGGGDITGGGFHLGFSTATGLVGSAGGGTGAPNPPFPWRAAMRSLSVPPRVMLSFASEADIPPPTPTILDV